MGTCHTSGEHRLKLRISAKLPAVYLFAGIAWMVGGNVALRGLGVNTANLPDLQMVFGGLFLIATSGILHWLIHHYLAALLRTKAELRRDNRAAQTLGLCSRTLVHGREPRELAADICRILVDEGGYRFAWVGELVGSGERTIQPLAHHGHEMGYLKQLAPEWDELASIPPAKAPGEPEASSASIRRIDPSTATTASDKAALVRGYRSSIALPLVNPEAVFGMLYIYAEEANAFDDRETGLLQTLAADLAFGLTALRNQEARHRAERHLRESRARLDYLLSHSPVVIFGCTLDDKLTFHYLSDNVINFLGYSSTAIMNNGALLWQEEAETLVSTVQKALLSKGQHSFEQRVVHRDGTTHWLKITMRMTRNHVERQPPEVVGCCLDVTDKKQADLQLHLLSRATEQSPASVLITDTAGRIEYANPTFTVKTGYSLAEIRGQTPRFLKSGAHSPELYRQLWETIHDGRLWREEIQNRKKNGELYWVNATISPIRDETGRITHFVRTAADITAQKTAQETIKQLAYFDNLTGFPNQTLFSERIAQTLTPAQRQWELAAVLLLDLDQLSQINRTFGQDFGDTLLKSVADRLKGCLEKEDVAARLTASTFGILMPHLKSEKEVMAKVKQIFAGFQQPILLQSREFFITFSVGIAQFPFDGTDAPTLLKNADAALYRARRQGGNNYQLYAPVMSERAKEQITFESSLRQALERNEFHLHFQPQMDVRTGTMVGVEALLRWKHPLLGMVAPTRFIPLAEKIGLIIPIGEWVLRTACEQNQRWQRQGLAPLRLAVNLSPRQFRQPDMVGMVARIVGETGQDPRLLDLEITEGALMENVEQAVETLLALKELGIRICIDDFGTGYSSLSYLKRFPLDLLKIDRSFIMGLPDDGDDAAIINAILAMARSLRLDVIAEGVETEQQKDYLLSQQCVGMQGYLFSRPLPGEELAGFARRTQLGVSRVVAGNTVLAEALA